MPGERPQGAAGFLRLSGRALDALTDDEPDRVHLCDGPFAAATNEGLRQPGSFVDDGLHAGPPGRAPLATPQRFGSDCSCPRWKGIQGWIDGSGERRLTLPSTTFDNISLMGADPPLRSQFRRHPSELPSSVHRFRIRQVRCYPPGTGSAQILRSMSPNSRRFRCPSANKSQ